MRDVDAPGCGRENDLVAFLYNELSESEQQSFESHLRACRLCQAETREFGTIRESVAAWRDESLGHASSSVPATLSLINQEKVSTFAAFRAFFDLSPLWMKGAVGFAVVLFCIFSVLAIVNLRNAPAVATRSTGQRLYSAEELQSLVEQRVKDELSRRQNAEQPGNSPPQVHVSVKEKLTAVGSRSRADQNNAVAANSRSQKARRPLSKAEREQLAADLRLVLAGNERNLDDEQINQQ